ncbi:hypothetical protein [Methanoculleus sp.]|jgi:hypothetical protein|uniref:hypothetical protein n=1 Tax=Methanoculleus sp. TaxID=90427 RepID=UPI0026077BBD|nr:hypothetical protein [Methanoculleus sp.]MDI6867361.1 hypothetical protein [Methanoculleus sp.]
MGDIRIFCIDGAETREIKGLPVALEKSLQNSIDYDIWVVRTSYNLIKLQEDGE